MPSAPQLLGGAAALAGILYAAPALLLKRRPALLLPWLWAIGTIGLLAAMDLSRSTLQLQHIRYTLLASPAMYLLLASLFWSDRGLLRLVLPALAVAVCVLDLPDAYSGQNPNWPGLAQYLDERAATDDLLVFLPPPIPEWTGYACVGAAHYATRPLPPALILRPPLPPDQTAALARFPRVWLINGSPQTGYPAIAGYTPQSERKIEGLNVTVLELTRSGR